MLSPLLGVNCSTQIVEDAEMQGHVPVQLTIPAFQHIDLGHSVLRPTQMDLSQVRRQPGPEFVRDEPSIDKGWHQRTTTAEQYLIDLAAQHNAKKCRGQTLQFTPNTPGAPQAEWDGVAVTEVMVQLRKCSQTQAGHVPAERLAQRTAAS